MQSDRQRYSAGRSTRRPRKPALSRKRQSRIRPGTHHDASHDASGQLGRRNDTHRQCQQRDAGRVPVEQRPDDGSQEQGWADRAKNAQQAAHRYDGPPSMDDKPFRDAAIAALRQTGAVRCGELDADTYRRDQDRAYERNAAEPRSDMTPNPSSLCRVLAYRSRRVGCAENGLATYRRRFLRTACRGQCRAHDSDGTEGAVVGEQAPARQRLRLEQGGSLGIVLQLSNRLGARSRSRCLVPGLRVATARLLSPRAVELTPGRFRCRARCPRVWRRRAVRRCR